jgi:hypothetical protein
MNRALDIKNWGDGGNNYVLKGNPKNKWVGFQETVLNQLSESFGDNFNIVIWTDENNDNDYYCIPYIIIKHLFVSEHKTTGKYPDRWTAIIKDHRFLMHSNSQLAVDISFYYSKPFHLEAYNGEVLDDVKSKTEGGKSVVISIKSERDQSLRKEAIKYHGLTCKVCSFNFKEAYGKWGEYFIEVHHIKPLSELTTKETLTNPKTDLTVVCANCHRMIHTKKGITLTLEELKKKLNTVHLGTSLTNHSL